MDYTLFMSMNRRTFVKKALTLSAISCCAPLSCFSSESIPIEWDLMEEIEKQKQAIYTLNFASPYKTSSYSTIPHLHQILKFHIETLSEGKIFVSIFDNGQLGTGTELMAAVAHKRVDAALISVSNLSRALPLLDILNIPFWAGNNQKYLNLTSSKSWKDLVLKPIQAQGKFQVLLHHIVGPRTLSTVKRSNKSIILPDDLNETTLRVPASKVLNHFYAMTKANIIEVPWGNVARMARLGLIDALDPSIIGLHAGPSSLRQNLKHISKIESVPDAWVTAISQHWLKSLPAKLRNVVFDSAKATFEDHLNTILDIELTCQHNFSKLGTSIYTPTDEELFVWKDRFGHKQPAWRSVKKQLLGDLKTFDKLLDATNETSPYKLS
ncbi:TRAP transporter substrate-binding protein DctP [Pseudoalteromonas phenolica O-BC30]|uniref:TRAP-type C4-dicarboxylate transport system,periplasmic component n=2 Tax=Pseudoalteromonas phenolica TaxID=161398 RepID=A0A0S2K263_9GAMM|nr:TRAP-type C4-dicarboxylate transport system,periplasmic component [Pseudoalteromonas phenolica]RXF02763.1 TRAP transporter substrate-binding protein DctP [Pseudoalteromonas phenolica O-BC30]